MELIYYLIFLDRDKMDVYWDKSVVILFPSAFFFGRFFFLVDAESGRG